MPIGPTTYFRKERVFVDREACIQAFRENVQKSGTQSYNVLSYYGIAGIGKSKLQKMLQRILDEEYPEILWVSIDLNTRTYREVSTFFITLRNKIEKKCKAKFYLFNTIHAIYWKKLHPEIPLQKDNYPLIKEGEFFSKIINVLDEFGSVHAGKLWDIINSAPDNIRRFFKEKVIDINELLSMEAHELEELLPGFFAADFTSYLGTNLKAYIFIDTYEALWEDVKNRSNFHETDAWIRDNLIPNLYDVSWVISGREKLLWVTECDPEWGMYLEMHSMDPLKEIYCSEFLEDCGIENKDIQDLIIRASRGVPYYLNLSVDTFENISKKRKPVYEDFGKTQLDVFNTFIKDLDSTEIQALEVLSTPNFWDRNLFEILMDKFDPELPTSAFSELIKLSFIKKDPDGKYFIHQLTRNSLQEHQDPIERENVQIFMFEYYNNKLKEMDIKSITQEYEKALIEAFYHAKKAYETKDLLNWFIAASKPFNRAAFWQLIIPMYEEMLQILEAKFGFEHPDVATTLYKLAGLYSRMGNYEKALPLFQRALAIREKVLGPQNSDVADSLNDLALLYESMGNYAKALPLYQRSLEINEKALGSEHQDVAGVLSNLAKLYYYMGNYEKALPIYHRSLDIYQRAFNIDENVQDPKHLDFATTLNSLAVLYYKNGDYEKALPIYQRALDIRENFLGPKHPSVANSLNNIAVLYLQMGDYDKALPLFQRAFEISENVLGPKHPDVAHSLNNLAGLYFQMGDYDKALPFFQRAFDIRENALGPKHPDVAHSLNNLAVLYCRMGNHEKALPFYQRVLSMREELLGPKHPDVAATLQDLAGFYHHKGDYKKALFFYQRALESSENFLGPKHPDIATILNNLAGLYNKMGDYEKSLSFHLKALEIRENVLGPRHLSVANSLNSLAVLYYQKRDYKKALLLYQRALEISENVLGSKHPDVLIIQNNLSVLYRQIG